MKTDYTAILINSKTNGEHYTIVDKKALDHLQSFPGFRGFCIQSTNTKKEGRNPFIVPMYIWPRSADVKILRKANT